MKIRLTENNEPHAHWWRAGSLLFALAAAAPLLLHAGFLNTRGGGDSPFLLFRLHQLVTALGDGVFPVRWMPDAAFGLGYPFFNYYASLPFYFAAGFRALGLSYVLSLKLTHLAGFVVAAWGVFAWVRRVVKNDAAALLASAAYTFAPYHLVNVYVRGDSLVEFWAMAWFPLILLALHAAAERPSARRLALVALSFAALVMTHNVSALIFTPFIAIYGLGSALANKGVDSPGGKGRFARILGLGGAGLLGLALAAWVWLPALGEQAYAQLGEQTTGYFFYGNHFRAGDLVQPGFFFDYDTGAERTTPFSMGLVQAVLTGLGGAALTYRMIRERAWWRDGFLLFGLVLSTIMITPLSKSLWSHIPLLPFAQFPWRFLSVQALFGAAAVGSLVFTGDAPPTPADGERRWHILSRTAGPFILGLLLVLSGLGALKPDFIPLSDAGVTAERLQWYESFSGNIGTTIRYEYLPTWTQPRPYASDILLGREPRAKFLEGSGTAARLETHAASQVWQIAVKSETAQVTLPLLYWPGWWATIIESETELAPGRTLPLSPVEGLGTVLLTLPEGEHLVRLRLGRTPLRLGAEIASLVALVILIGLWRPRLPRWDWLGWTFAAAGVVSLVVLAMVLHSLPEPASDPHTLSADFAQEAYFYGDPGGIPFEDGYRLYSATTEIEGGTLNGNLVWQGGDAPPDVSVAVSAPPQQAAQGGPILSDERPITALMPGLYFTQVTRPGIYALAHNGQPRGTLYMLPVIVGDDLSAPGEEATTVDVTFDFARLEAVESWSESESLTVILWWEVLHEAAKNCAVALRLVDEAGNEWAAFDTQAGGAGMYPTGLWRPGETMPDAYRLALPPGTPPGLYRLRVTLYDAVTLNPINSVEVDGIAYNRVSSAACADYTALMPDLAVTRVDLPESLAEGDPLPVTVNWLACQAPASSYRVKWSLLAGDGTPVYEIVTPLAAGSEPTTWTPEPGSAAFVQGRHRLALPRDLLPGSYRLVMQIIGENGDPAGEPFEVGTVTLEGRARNYDLPPLETSLDVTFGGQIRLWGYILQRENDSLILNVAWGALTDPDRDYKLFVHLFDPATEAIPAQIDTMPRDYTYPTSLWAVGEVIDEQLILDLSGVPPGTYRIALGWYDPGADRLAALDADGNPLPDRRLILDDVITVP